VAFIYPKQSKPKPQGLRENKAAGAILRRNTATPKLAREILGLKPKRPIHAYCQTQSGSIKFQESTPFSRDPVLAIHPSRRPLRQAPCGTQSLAGPHGASFLRCITPVVNMPG